MAGEECALQAEGTCAKAHLGHYKYKLKHVVQIKKKEMGLER